ncbi:MAG: transglutaminase-like domain-containing protein [Prevotellaceae bacterium]|jgi:hypothetical protein|nr:transglutaminase-like domain-containing protein [Prevotellaceae bacterium]
MLQSELNKRIALDFNKNLDALLAEIRQIKPDFPLEMVEKLENENILETFFINNEKRYFRRAARNIFRTDKDLKQFFIKNFGDEKEVRNDFLKKYLPTIVGQVGALHAMPLQQHFRFNFKLNVNAELKEGELLRVWLPFPRQDVDCQQNIKLLYAGAGLQPVPKTDYIISENSPHQSIYFEKIVKNGEKNEFEVEFEFETTSFHAVGAGRALPLQNPTCKTAWLQEQPPHIVFTENMRKISAQIIGNEQNNYLKAKKIFEYISQNFPWAVAREYSTIDNIPEYVLAHKFGDCGQVSLLFIALCRLNGIPARWQSGFMLHPNCENLHDWAEIFIEGVGWLPVDVSFGLQNWTENPDLKYFYFGNMDTFRLIVNNDISADFFPKKTFERSETVDFQRGEVETSTRNLYFDEWEYSFKLMPRIHE